MGVVTNMSRRYGREGSRRYLRPKMFLAFNWLVGIQRISTVVCKKHTRRIMLFCRCRKSRQELKVSVLLTILVFLKVYLPTLVIIRRLVWVSGNRYCASLTTTTTILSKWFALELQPQLLYHRIFISQLKVVTLFFRSNKLNNPLTE